MAKLLVNESAGTREFDLVDAEAHIGRELDNSLRLADPSISRHHAVVRRTATGYEVQDLQSSNGVLLNGSRVQTAPLQDGDRLTLGQIQLTFQDPQAGLGATVAITRSDMPEVPLGTMRMNADQIAQIHGTAPAASPANPPTAPIVPLPPPEPPAPVPTPAPAMQIQRDPMDTAPRPATPPKAEMAPAFGQFTNPGTSGATMSGNPLHAVLHPYLPPVPDDAQPTGERGDFVTRLLAVLVDMVVGFIFYIPVILLGFIPLVNCVVALLSPLLGLAMLGFQLWCVVKFKATIGKKMMKLRIVREDDPNAPLDWSVAILRLVGYMVSGFLLGLPYLMIFGGERKGLQDIFSKSIVIKVDR